MKSKLWKMKMPDWIVTLFFSVLTAVVTAIYNMVANGVYPVTVDAWRLIGTAALLAFIAGIGAHLGINSEGKPLKPDPKPEE